MPSPKVFEKYGLRPEDLKAQFIAEQKEDGIKKLIEFASTAIRDGRTSNLKDFKSYRSADLAYDAALNQGNPTLLNNILSRDLDIKSKLELLAKWGMDMKDCVYEYTAPDGSKQISIQKPVLHNVVLPLVKAYLTMRLAKLVNDRNQWPFLKYEPLKLTEENRILCEIVTDLVNAIVTNYGYFSVFKKAVLNALLYSEAFVFPCKVWEVEYEEGESGEDETVREGISFTVPHPTRVFYDAYKPPCTLNTDTGCTYAGYWHVVPFKEIEDNALFWNKDDVPFGQNWFEGAGQLYFNEVYPCVLQYPSLTEDTSNDREKRASRYSTTNREQAVFLTNFFCKIKPDTYKLGGKDGKHYKHNVWFRMVMASDDTVVWMEPFAYDPVGWMGYDADEARARSASMAQEVIPFQDEMSNLVQQLLMTIRQNHFNITFLDKTIISDPDMEKKLRLAAHTTGAGPIIYPYDGKMSQREHTEPEKALKTISFPPRDFSEDVVMMGQLLNILDRLLVVSAQERGATATHEQTREEIITLNQFTNTRVSYTGTFVDEFLDSWKRKLYLAAQAYADEDFTSQVTSPDGKEEQFKKLGLEIKERGDENRMIVTGKTSILLKLEGFSASGRGINRIQDPKTAAVMMQTIQVIAANETMMQAVGVKWLADQLTEAALLAGAPRDFKVKVSQLAVPGQVQQIMQVVQKLIGEAAKATQEDTMEKVTEGIKPLAEKVAEDGQVIETIAKQALPELQQMSKEHQEAIARLIEQLQPIQQALAAAPPLPPVQQQMPVV